MTESDLVQEIEQAAQTYARLDNFYRPLLVRLCERIVGAEDADEVVQDVLVHAWLKLSQVKDFGKFRAWLFRIAHNECMDTLKRRRDTVPLDAIAELIGDGTDMEGDALIAEVAKSNVARLARARDRIATLSPAQRECIEMVAQEMNCQQIARVRGTSVEAVKTNIHKARLRLRNYDQQRLNSGNAP